MAVLAQSPHIPAWCQPALVRPLSVLVENPSDFVFFAVTLTTRSTVILTQKAGTGAFLASHSSEENLTRNRPRHHDFVRYANPFCIRSHNYSLHHCDHHRSQDPNPLHNRHHHRHSLGDDLYLFVPPPDQNNLSYAQGDLVTKPDADGAADEEGEVGLREDGSRCKFRICIVSALGTLLSYFSFERRQASSEESLRGFDRRIAPRRTPELGAL